MPHDHHDHHTHSPSGHPYQPDDDTALTETQVLEIAIRELLVEKGVLTSDAIQAQVEAMDRRAPADGARVVARAWIDPDFKTRLLEDGSAAMREMGLEPGPMHLVALENTADVHNIVVCTLCSCYPRNLLGLPPAWYKSRAYRSRTVKEPRKVLAEFGVTLPPEVQVRVHDSTADMRYLVVPKRPEGTEGFDQEALAALISRDAMIGTGLVARPS
ncbi:MAG: nitrile hydratase subunit alpha [Pseudomonadota bacterium]